jgi:hypothetical protein
MEFWRRESWPEEGWEGSEGFNCCKLEISDFRKNSVFFFEEQANSVFRKFYIRDMQSDIYMGLGITFFLEMYPLNNFYIFTALSYFISIYYLFFFI